MSAKLNEKNSGTRKVTKTTTFVQVNVLILQLQLWKDVFDNNHDNFEFVSLTSSQEQCVMNEITEEDLLDDSLDEFFTNYILANTEPNQDVMTRQKSGC